MWHLAHCIALLNSRQRSPFSASLFACLQSCASLHCLWRSVGASGVACHGCNVFIERALLQLPYKLAKVSLRATAKVCRWQTPSPSPGGSSWRSRGDRSRLAQPYLTELDWLRTFDPSALLADIRCPWFSFLRVDAPAVYQLFMRIYDAFLPASRCNNVRKPSGSLLDSASSPLAEWQSAALRTFKSDEARCCLAERLRLGRLLLQACCTSQWTPPP